jgi:tetratricopeptide (TPR) repeat protein
MSRFIVLAAVLLLGGAWCLAQQPSSDPNPSIKGSSAADSSSRSSSTQGPSSQNTSSQDSSNQDSSRQADADREAQESSSRDTQTDIGPPQDDAKNHPYSKSAVADLEPTPPADTTGVEEFHPWNPFKASKDVEVGDYYFKRKNYRAALERYKEALYYKDNDAVATYRLAVCQEKMGNKAEARKNFEQYLKILPEGPLAKDARASLEKLSDKKGP